MKALKRAAVFHAALFTVLLVLSGASFAANMQCAPYQSIGPSPTGATYSADADGILVSVPGNDVAALSSAGCSQIGNAGLTMIGRIVGANMNVTTDQAIQSFMSGGAYYVPAYMIVKDCSVSLTTAKGAAYDTASKGGAILFGSATQVYTACTGAGTAESMAAVSTGYGVVDSASANPPILALTTVQGAAATANVYIYGYVLGK